MDPFDIFYLCAESLIAVISVLGNALIIWLWFEDKSLRKIKSNKYLIALAISNFSLGLFGIASSIAVSEYI
jgi:hypothetical protein